MAYFLFYEDIKSFRKSYSHKQDVNYLSIHLKLFNGHFIIYYYYEILLPQNSQAFEKISNDILDDENIKDLSYFFTCGV